MKEFGQLIGTKKEKRSKDQRKTMDLEKNTVWKRKKLMGIVLLLKVLREIKESLVHIHGGGFLGKVRDFFVGERHFQMIEVILKMN